MEKNDRMYINAIVAGDPAALVRLINSKGFNIEMWRNRDGLFKCDEPARAMDEDAFASYCTSAGPNQLIFLSVDNLTEDQMAKFINPKNERNELQ